MTRITSNSSRLSPQTRSFLAKSTRTTCTSNLTPP